MTTTSGVTRDEYNLLRAVQLTEKRFMEIVIAEARRDGWLVYHVFDARRSTPGYPDLHLVHPTRHLSVFAELKRQKGARITPDQRTWLNALESAGHQVHLWRPLDWFDGTIPHLLDPRNLP